MSLFLEKGRKAYSILIYIETNILPLLEPKEVTWDLTPSGLHAVLLAHSHHPQILLYTKARYCRYLSLSSRMMKDMLTATRYSHEESDLYGSCAAFLQQVNFNLSSSVSLYYVGASRHLHR